MNIKPIKTKKDHANALMRIDEIFEAKKGTLEFDELDILATLVEVYEQKKYAIAPPKKDAIDILKDIMKENGLHNNDLVQYIGNKGNVSSILNKKRALTVEMIKNLSKGLHIPSQLLIGA